MMTAELQLNIQAREQKMADVKTSAQACKVSCGGFILLCDYLFMNVSVAAVGVGSPISQSSWLITNQPAAEVN